MTNKEAIFRLEALMSLSPNNSLKNIGEALRMAISSLEKDENELTRAEWDNEERCSACGEKSTEGLDAEKWNYWLPPYCPHCGAKMDLE